MRRISAPPVSCYLQHLDRPRLPSTASNSFTSYSDVGTHRRGSWFTHRWRRSSIKSIQPESVPRWSQLGDNGRCVRSCYQNLSARVASAGTTCDKTCSLPSLPSRDPQDVFHQVWDRRRRGAWPMLEPDKRAFERSLRMRVRCTGRNPDIIITTRRW